MSNARTFSLLIAAALACWWVAAAAMEAQAPMEKLAQSAAQRPFKLDVRPLAPSAPLGGKVSLEILLLDAANRQVAWKQKSELYVDVTVTGPSKKSRTYKVSIKPGDKAGSLTFEPSEAGVLSLRAREVNDNLLPGGNSVLVRKPIAFRPVPRAEPVGLLKASFHVGEPRPLPAMELTEQEPQTPSLLLEDSTGREILSDGKDSARIQVYFVDPKGGAAPSDIKVWLKWSNGALTPQPLVIKKGEFVAEAKWISRSPLEATVSVATTGPKYPVEGARELKVTFSPPIHAIGFLNPNPLSLSLIDYAPINVAFFTLADDGKTLKPVNTSKLRRVTVTPSNALLRLNTLSGDVKENESSIPFYVLPAWYGVSALHVSTPDYETQVLDVQVSVLLVLLLCLSGGVLGGLAATESLKGSRLWRVFIGVIGAIGLVWFSVYAVLPQTISIIAHNLVSVLVVGIIGGYGGTRVLDFLGKKFGYL